MKAKILNNELNLTEAGIFSGLYETIWDSLLDKEIERHEAYCSENYGECKCETEISIYGYLRVIGEAYALDLREHLFNAGFEDLARDVSNLNDEQSIEVIHPQSYNYGTDQIILKLPDFTEEAYAAFSAWVKKWKADEDAEMYFAEDNEGIASDVIDFNVVVDFNQLDEYFGVLFDGCHKIYLIKNDFDDNMKQRGYSIDDVFNIKSLPTIYEDSCGLKFISDWDSLENIVSQGQSAKFANFPSDN